MMIYDSLDPTARTQTMVSPENSEDGYLPPVADTSGSGPVDPSAAYLNIPDPTAVAPAVPAQQQSETLPAPTSISTQFQQGFQEQQQQQHHRASAPAAPPASAAPTTVSSMQFQQQQQHHEAPAPAAPPSNKRQKVGETMTVSVPMVAVTGQNGSVVLSTEQLAAAAAQAMQQGRGRKKSQAQIDRRRERNRILARRTRLRKKFFFESLQKEVMDLHQENAMLKQLVKQNIAEEHAKPILAECDAMEKLPPSVVEACCEGTDMDAKDFNLVKSIQVSQHAFIITDPSLQDNPIVFASDDFLKMTGYSREQVLGRNCRFLQGPDTDKGKVETIRRGLANGEDVSVTLLNYTADGTPFWNKLFVAALRDAQNNVVNHIGVSVKVAAPPEGDPEHEKALPAVKKQAAENAVKAIEGTMAAAVAAAAGGPL